MIRTATGKRGTTGRKQFTAVLQEPQQGWLDFVVMPGSAAFSGTRGLVKVGHRRRPPRQQLVHGRG
ncbi:MAG TPA: hypothetical protein VK283_07125 [Acidimicrobiales bacterium]|nr:hypothetical protein [Acidimicrobiales bacterium]